MMNVLLIGSGGREHALAWKLNQSDLMGKLYCIPGNAGIETIANCPPIKETEHDKIVAFCKDNDVALVVIGPEAPLVAGLSDILRNQNIPVFGPSQAAAQIEGSKAFMKDLLHRAGVPTARYGRFTKLEDAIEFIEKSGAPIVVKTDGLAAGKGVIIAQTKQEAIQAAKDMLSGASFGEAGKEVVIEEFLEGEEISYFSISDGKSILHLTSAQDHKRVGDGDTGPNTGGMGAYSPAHMMTPELEQKIISNCINPTFKTMEKEGYPFAGVLFTGIMLTATGPKVLEYNVRFGDPECQTLMMRLEGDLLDVLYAAAKGQLKEKIHDIGWSKEPSLCIVMAAKGYPGAYVKGSVISGLNMPDHATLFHAGTKKSANGTIISNGGRVLNICAKGTNIAEARDNAYRAVRNIDWPDGFCRSDIAWRALK